MYYNNCCLLCKDVAHGGGFCLDPACLCHLPVCKNCGADACVCQVVYDEDGKHVPAKLAPWNDPTVKWVCEEHPRHEQGHKLFFGLYCDGAGMPEDTPENRAKGYITP